MTTRLPLPSCIVTNVGNDRPQHFMLTTGLGVALMERGAGSTLCLYTAEQLIAHAAHETAALREINKALVHKSNGYVIANARLEERVAVLEDALRTVAASHAWQLFGECRAFGTGRIPSPSQCDEIARAALNKESWK